MKVPSVFQGVLLFFLGGVFLHFLLAGARTFVRSGMSDDRAAAYAQGSFVFGGTCVVWFLGLRQQIPVPNGVAAAAVLVMSIALYEWARHSIWMRGFRAAWSGFVPDELCERGPYRYVRHPVYVSYLLAFLAAAIALPHPLTVAIFVVNLVLLILAVRDEERAIAASPLAAGYAAYRERAGMLWPRLRSTRLSRSGPGR
jgi:protein-S-isoprenylcysteine O-methyltransferase Ste14